MIKYERANKVRDSGQSTGVRIQYESADTVREISQKYENENHSRRVHVVIRKTSFMAENLI